MKAKWNAHTRAYGDCKFCLGKGHWWEDRRHVACTACLQRRVNELDNGVRQSVKDMIQARNEMDDIRPYDLHLRETENRLRDLVE